MWSSPSSSSCPPRSGSRRGARTADAPPLGRRLERPTICCCQRGAILLDEARRQERGLNGRRYVSGRDTPGASGVVRPRSAETGRHLPLCCGTEPPERGPVFGGAAWFPCGAQLPRRSLIPCPRRRIFRFCPAPPKTHRPSATLAPPRGESRRSAGTCGRPEGQTTRSAENPAKGGGLLPPDDPLFPKENWIAADGSGSQGSLHRPGDRIPLRSRKNPERFLMRPARTLNSNASA